MNTERLLRRLRQRVFDYTGKQDEQCDRLIKRCKERLAPQWQAKAKSRENSYARVMWM